MTEQSPEDGRRDGLDEDERVDLLDYADEDWRDDRPDELLEDEPPVPPAAGRPDPAPAPQRWRAARVAAGVAGVLALVRVVVTVLRRRRPSARTERLRQALTRTRLEDALSGAGSLAAAAGGVAAAAGGLATTAGGGVASVARTGQEAAEHTAEHLVASLGHVSGVLAEEVAQVRRWWRRLLFRLMAAGSFATGYVLGARAGRQRYEDIAAAVRRATGRARRSGG